MRLAAPPHRHPAARSGFTLIELLAVIVVISILIALLLPAINSIRGNANITVVKTELNQLASGIASFKTDFGVEPPSSIILCENASDWDDASISTPTLASRQASKATLLRMWPQFDFTLSRDINQDNDSTDTLILSGPECLVFFLGGVVKNPSPGSNLNSNTALTLSGFSSNPADPFAQAGTTRKTFFTFKSDRLQNINTNNPNCFAYYDTISGMKAPLLYISSNDGQGYNVADLNGAMTDVYRQSNTGGTSATPWNPQSFQLISPGADGKYGVGGYYQKSDANWSSGTGRNVELDNITNFSEGTLGSN